MTEKYFFEIPVFRCTKEQFLKERKEESNKLIQDCESIISTSGVKDKNYDCKKWVLSLMKKSSYHYSELIGFIRLYSIPNQIRAQLYFVNKRISRNLVRKPWCYMDNKMFEIWIRHNDTNETLFNRIVERINDYKENSKLSKFVIDMECFNNGGRFVDFLKIDEDAGME